MGAGYNEYSLTAADNVLINSINIGENNLPSTINNAIRQLLADVRAAMEDIAASQTCGGTNAHTLTSKTGWTAYADGMIVAYKVAAANTTNVTLNVNGIGAKALVRGDATALVSGDLPLGCFVMAVYKSGTDKFHLLNYAPVAPVTASSTSVFTNKTFDANATGNVLSNVEVADLAAAAVVTAAETIAANINDTTLPTTSAVNTHVVGQQTIWVPSGAMVPNTTNGPSSGSLEATTNKNMLSYLAFDSSTREKAQFGILMPKGWDEGTLIAQFVWAHPATVTNFGVSWELAAVACANDDTGDVAFGTLQEIDDTGGTTSDIYITDETPAITVAGSPGNEEYVMFQVSRDPADAGDTMAVDAYLLGVKVHYTTSAPKDD